MPLPSTLSARIRAASDSHPILRRALASQLYAEMAKLPDSLGLAADWRAIGRVLIACEVELYADDMDRAREFFALGRDAHNRSVLMGVRCKGAALRAGRRVPRVIEATCVEVAS